MGAVFTLVQDEPEFFPIWLRHYKQAYSKDQIYVLHHALPGLGDTIPSWLGRDTADGDYQLITVRNDVSFSHVWMQETVARFQQFLIMSHATALFTAVDEIVFPHPGLGNPSQLSAMIDDRLLTCGADAWTCLGYDVVQRRS